MDGPTAQRLYVGMLLCIGAMMLTGCADRPSQEDGGTPAEVSQIPEEVTEQIARLSAPDAKDRAEAALALQKMGLAAAPAASDLAGLLSDETRVVLEMAWSGGLSQRVARGSSTAGVLWSSTPVGDLAGRALVQIGEPAIDPLISVLQHSDDEKARIRAAEYLTRIETPRERIDDAMASVLDSDSLELALYVARQLAERGDPRGTERLEEFLTAEGELLQFAVHAARYLAIAGDPRGTERLAECLGAEDESIRRKAAVALQLFTDPRTVAPLTAALSVADEKPNIRLEILRALNRHHTPEVREVLVGLMRDESGEFTIRSAAAGFLALTRDQLAFEVLVTWLEDDDASHLLQQSAANSLRYFRNRRSTDALIQALLSRSDGRSEAAKTLAYMNDPRIVEPLITVLREATGSAVRDVIETLGMIGDRRAVEPLLARLAVEPRTTVYVTRASILRALVKIGDKRAMPAFIEALGSDNRTFQLVGAEGLGKLKDPRGIKPLLASLGGQDDRVVVMAAEALGEIGDRRAIGPLLRLREDKTRKYNVWSIAITALGKLKAREAVDLLILELDGHSSSLAATALGNIGDPRAAEPLMGVLNRSSPRLQTIAAEALASLNARGLIPRLVAALEGEDSDFRFGAALALAHMDDARCLPPLLDALSTTDEQLHFHREKAALALAHIKEPRVVEALITTLQTHSDLRARLAAAESLGEIGSRRAVEPLIDALEDNWLPIKIQAAKSLGEIGDPRAIEALQSASQFAIGPSSRSEDVRKRDLIIATALRQIEDR